MSYAEWIARVVAIAESRGIVLTLTWRGGGEVYFSGVYPGTSWTVQAGANPAIVGPNNTPEDFTMLWFPPPREQYLRPPGMQQERGDEIERHGKHVPRVPAMATNNAIGVLFS